MEEAIVDVALDLNRSPSENLSQKGIQGDTRSNQRDQTQILATVPQIELVSSPLWPEEQSTDRSPERSRELDSSWLHKRAARVEALRQCVANGTYLVDSSELAFCILRNSTRFVETR
jgi:anti-sigma28 factor (negative regulator of flagellin synthesis)